MNTKINVRSPYYVKLSDSDLHYATLNLYIWEGLSSAYYDTIDSIQDRVYLAITYTSSNINVSGIPSDKYGYVLLKFQTSPIDGEYSAICYKNGEVYKRFEDITVDVNGNFTLYVGDMKDGDYTFDLFYGQSSTTVNFVQLSGGYNNSEGQFLSGFTNGPTSIPQTISYTETTDYGTPKYTFTKTEVGSNNYVVFELSEYIKDFLITKYGNYSTDAVWVRYTYTKYDSDDNVITGGGSEKMLALDGYGYFDEGSNPQLSQQLLQSNTIIYYNEGQDIIFPIWAEFIPTITLTSGSGANVEWEAVNVFWSVYAEGWGYALDPIVVTDNGNTNQKIQYIRITLSEELQDGDTITITSGLEGGPVTVITLEEICEPKYQPLNIIFYNKFGALQNVWFFKKNTTTLNVSSESYKRSIMDFSGLVPDYSGQAHQVKTFNANGREVLQANTGFIDEQYNEVIKQLLMSEQVWVENGTDVLPIRPISNSLTLKTSVNDKLINYTLDFEYAFDKINNIR